jgi:hypothetical protein
MWHGGLHRGYVPNGGDHRATFCAQRKDAGSILNGMLGEVSRCRFDAPNCCFRESGLQVFPGRYNFDGDALKSKCELNSLSP